MSLPPPKRPEVEAALNNQLDDYLVSWRARRHSYGAIAQKLTLLGVPVTAQAVSDWCKPLAERIAEAKVRVDIVFEETGVIPPDRNLSDPAPQPKPLPPGLVAPGVPGEGRAGFGSPFVAPGGKAL